MKREKIMYIQYVSYLSILKAREKEREIDLLFIFICPDYLQKYEKVDTGFPPARIGQQGAEEIDFKYMLL